MKIMICAEGTHDMGEKAWNDKTRSYSERNGWIQVLLDKAAPRLRISEVMRVRRRELVSIGKVKLPAGLDGHGVKAFYAIRKAKREGCDAVIFMADADTKDKMEWAKKHQDIVDGFTAAETDKVGVPCVPKAASESWLLCDDSAWLRFDDKAKIKLPPKPEELSGERSDPKSNHPHQMFKRICDECGCSDSRETRCDVANDSSIAKIKEKCPLSFNAFLDDLKALEPLTKL